MSNFHGDPTIAITHTIATLASTISKNLLIANTQRKWAYFVNDGTTPAYLVITATSTGAAVKSTGIRINANGGTFEMSPTIGNLDTRACHAITAASTGHILLIATAS